MPTFVVEDGTGLSTATSYVSVADADSYVSTMGGNATWEAATNAQKQGALMYATRYLDDSFQWYSFIYSTSQALGWPRNSFTDKEGRTIPAATVHEPIKNATVEMALAHLSGGINETSSEGIQSEKIGDSSITYRAGGSQKSYSFVKVSLRQYGISSALRNNDIYRS
jgi:hypothetical protein